MIVKTSGSDNLKVTVVIDDASDKDSWADALKFNHTLHSQPYEPKGEPIHVS